MEITAYYTTKIVAKFHETSNEHIKEYIVNRRTTTTKKKLKRGWDKSSQASGKTFLTNLQRKKDGRIANGKPKKTRRTRKSTNSTNNNSNKQTKKPTNKSNTPTVQSIEDAPTIQSIEDNLNSTIRGIQERNNQLKQFRERLNTLSTNAREHMRKYSHLYTPQNHPYATNH